ncbi:hypothetical protein INS49_014050 [Diaporthe citri]|uniref:uncharacterized protein n=1 Tax=Diaporthe citri TaxID=83186 RepID=UPI001C8232D5|nr:uncharacterized protein INS49_014050 [Diaporthe citri]KAG6358166.1 hypothetical protein INS49_014050 [Diaporthe citri]
MSPTLVEGGPKLEAAICEVRSIIKQEDFINIKFEKDEFGHDKNLDVSKLVENDIYNEAVQKVGQEVVNQTKTAVRQRWPNDEIRWRANVIRHRHGSIAGYLSALLPIPNEASARPQIVFHSASHDHQAQRPAAVTITEGNSEIYLFDEDTNA